LLFLELAALARWPFDTPSALCAKVITLSVRDKQLGAVKSVGLADGTINVNKHDAAGLVKEVRALNDGNLADVVVMTSAVIMAYH
jgi:hypothetical protein